MKAYQQIQEQNIKKSNEKRGEKEKKRETIIIIRRKKLETKTTNRMHYIDSKQEIKREILNIRG